MPQKRKSAVKMTKSWELKVEKSDFYRTKIDCEIF